MASEAERYLRTLASGRLRDLMPDARIVHELNVDNGQCRVDLAAIAPDRMVFVEIKSRKDTLDRLKEQCRIFNPVCHGLAVLYASERWSYSAVSSAADGHVALWPEDQRSLWTFHDRYCPPNTSAMLNLLWAEELRAEGDKFGLQFTKRVSRSPMMHLLWEHLSGKEVVQAVCRQLRARPFAEADPPVVDQ